MNKYIKLTFLTIVIVLAGCEDVFDPADVNNLTLQDMYNDPAIAEGVLMNAYTRLPTNGYSFNDVATDDAVTNNRFSGFLSMATGQWSAINNPVEQWNNAYTAIMYLNMFISETDNVEWSYRSDTANTLFNLRHKGEAYGLRALFMYYLLQAHGGFSEGGELLGVPIVTEVMDANSSFTMPRNTFEECIQQIYNDLAEAGKYLPLDYGNVRNAVDLPALYSGYSVVEYNRVFGDFNRLRVSGRIVQAILAKTAFLAASPAYSDGTSTTWEMAANYAAAVLNANRGLAGLDPDGGVFYRGDLIDAINLAARRDQAEMLWRGSKEGGEGTVNLEREMFPPTLYGNGRVNPTQNLVDAFPMLNGYPISHELSGYDPSKPYENRDPRLKLYIVVDSSVLAGQVISTRTGSGNDAVDVLRTSTRTGYYMRKLIREDVVVNPVSTLPKRHYFPRIRYTEIFLMYAEAANEAWGPDGNGGNAYSARSVIAALRDRADIEQPDAYLASITTQEEMRELIRNERRLELSFEGFRFWDLRRWKMDLTEPALGVRITGDEYNVFEVEKRLYEDYMLYPPIPYSEVLKLNLVQNKGW